MFKSDDLSDDLSIAITQGILGPRIIIMKVCFIKNKIRKIMIVRTENRPILIRPDQTGQN